MGNQYTILEGRICQTCNTKKTFHSKEGKPYWFKHKDGFICKKCHSKSEYQQNHEQYQNWHKSWKAKNPQRIKEFNVKHGPMRIQFKGHRLKLNHNPQTGICSNCNRTVQSGEIKRTHLHHTKYDPNNPLVYTVELCVSCHVKIHWEMR